MVFHLQLINPLWPDARPWDTYLLIAIATVVVWLNRDLQEARGVTEPGEPGR